MAGLTSAIQRCSLQLKLDDKTEGYGNCFPYAIVQQCRRPEIRTWLQENKPQAIVNFHSTLRKKITNFALKSRHPTISDFKTKYDQILKQDNRKSWTEYWNEMAQDGTWIDYLFVQVCAWYMELDMLILTTSSTPTDPFIFISGNFNNIPASVTGPPLLLGNYTNVHYQSLLPVNNILNIEKRKQPECVLTMTLGDIKESKKMSGEDKITKTIVPEPKIYNPGSQPKLQEGNGQMVWTDQKRDDLKSESKLNYEEVIQMNTGEKKVQTYFEYKQHTTIDAMKAAIPMKTAMIRMQNCIQLIFGGVLTLAHLSTLSTEYLSNKSFSFLFFLLVNKFWTLSRSTTSSCSRT